MKIDWKQKLSSRKFWASIIGVVTAFLFLFNVDEVTVEKVLALITAESTLIAYIFAEGSIDNKRIKTEGDE